MKNFILKTLIATAIFAGIVAGFWLVNRWGSRWTISPDKQIVLLGHSHAERAWDDTVIPGMANFAESGESYFYTYPKGRRLIDRNRGIEIVLIEFSNSQVIAEIDEWVRADDHISYRLPVYAPVMDWPSLRLLFDLNSEAVIGTLPLVSKNNAVMLMRGLDYIPVIGGFHPLDETIDSAALASAATAPARKREGMATFGLDYLDRLVAHARSKRVEVMFVRTPVHRHAPELADEELFQSVRKARYGDVEFLDFGRFPLADTDFADTGHLNRSGATKFSEWIASLIESGLLEADDRQHIIDNSLARLSNR